jgi:hypothetical protein
LIELPPSSGGARWRPLMVVRQKRLACAAGGSGGQTGRLNCAKSSSTLARFRPSLALAFWKR